MDKINKFLKLFEEVNGYKVYKFKYICDNFEGMLSLEMLEDMYIDQANKVTLYPIKDWEEELLNKFAKCWLIKKPENLDLKGLSAEEFLIKLLKDYFGTSKIEFIKINVYPNKYHACSSEEYLIRENNSKLYFLSFQEHS